MRTNPLSSLRILEIGGADLADDRLSSAMQEMAFVPHQPLLIVPREEMSLFHIERQTDVPTHKCVQPCGSGPWRTDYDEIGHSDDAARSHHSSAALWLATHGVSHDWTFCSR